jgi:hypothetical protein
VIKVVAMVGPAVLLGLLAAIGEWRITRADPHQRRCEAWVYRFRAWNDENERRALSGVPLLAWRGGPCPDDES